MIAYAQQLAGASLPERCFAARILRAAAHGEIDASRCPMLFVDYLGPSLDTTISAIGNAIWLLATHPDQWHLLQDEPHRIKAAFNEALRLESPISCFTRVAEVDAVVGGVELPAGSRVLLSFASANRDERRWQEPERFDITRESAGQLAFGHGEHACIGMGLARLEGAAVLSALVERVSRIELAAEPRRKLNNLIRSFESLPVAVDPGRPQ
jgi:cytochrome P450